MVFMGSKWLAGWVLVLGSGKRRELIEKLKERDFMVFTDEPDIEDTTFIGDRETSPVYFLQLMVRYGLISMESGKRLESATRSQGTP